MKKLGLVLLCVFCVLLFQSFHRAGAAAPTPNRDTSPGEARLSEHVSIRAARRGNPRINLSDGHELEPVYSGSPGIVHALERNEVEPLSLASADFDEDGVPDLVSGGAAASHGIITLYRGNADSIYPNSPEAKQHQAEALSAMKLRSVEQHPPTPFLATVATLELPEPPAFIGAGDFNGDGHWDVATSSRANAALYFLSGDGRGGFGPVERVELPGPVTAMATGEINRRDGMVDIVVAVDGPAGPQVLVFEGPDGALKATPEVISVPAEVSALALGLFDDDYSIDLALGAGSELLILHGRDRKTYLADSLQRGVPPPVLDRLPLKFMIISIAAGNFTGTKLTDLALGSASGEIRLLSRDEAGTSGFRRSRTGAASTWLEQNHASLPASTTGHTSKLLSVRSSSPGADDLLAVGSDGLEIIAIEPRERDAEQLSHLLRPPRVVASFEVEGGPVAVLAARLNEDALSDLVVLKGGHIAPSLLLTQAMMTFTVTNTNDSGAGSLRQAILDANTNPGPDTIRFQIGSGVQTITPSLALPEITDPVTIDGTTQPGFAGTPIIELNGSNSGACDGGLLITAGSSVVRGLIINRCPCQAITLWGPGGGSIVEGNFIGTDVSGSVNLNTLDGVLIGTDIFRSTFRPVSSNNTIGGTTAAARNVMVHVSITGWPLPPNQTPSSGNVVLGNLIGTDVTGTSSLRGSGVGIVNLAEDNTIGGLTAGATNVISGGTLDGVDLGAASLLRSNATLIQGNLIGTAANGIDPLGNDFRGIVAEGRDNTIDRNTIAFNGARFLAGRDDGIFVDSFASGCRITRNRIYSNGGFVTGLGIRLAPGTNNNQPVPSLSSANVGPVLATVEGSILAAPFTTYRIEFFGNDACDPSGFGEGQTPLGSTDVTTINSGLGSFSATVFRPLAGQTVVTATATDPAGNTSEFSRCIQINNAPVAQCRNITKSADSTCRAAVTPQEVDNGSSDPDGDAITLSLNPAGPFKIGSTSVTLTVTDSNGGSSSCIATVTVVDVIAPIITCPANIILGNDAGLCSTVVQNLGSLAVTDCTATTLSSARSDGRPLSDPFPVGTTTITRVVTDAAGNSSSCQQTVTVRDTEAPRPTCPANIVTSTAPGQCSATVIFSLSAGDNCTLASLVSSPPSGSIFPKGTTTVTVTATDAATNTSTCSFTVTVNDTEPPRVGCPPNVTTATARPGDTSVTVNYSAPAASDNCGGATASCTPPSGSSFALGTTTVVCTATDARANAASCSFSITVVDMCLQDDSNSGVVLLFNSVTGDYVFCCGTVSYAGRGVVRKIGTIYTLDHSATDRRVIGRVDAAVRRGTASLQAPPGTTICTITDRDIANNTCACDGIAR